MSKRNAQYRELEDVFQSIDPRYFAATYESEDGKTFSEPLVAVRVEGDKLIGYVLSKGEFKIAHSVAKFLGYVWNIYKVEPF
jgi:hypothetical protein